MTHAEQIRDCILHDTDPAFPHEANRYGCRVFVLLAIPQFVVGRCLSSEQILNLIAHGRVTDGVIISETMRTGAEEHHLIDWAFEALGSDRHGRQVGWSPEHVVRSNWQYMMRHWETAGDDGHYDLADRGQKLLYDPHNIAQAGYSIDKRKIVRRLTYATWGADGTT